MYCILFIVMLTPWSRLLQMLTSSQPVKKFPAFYGTRRFITAFTRFRHLSCHEPDQSSSCLPLHFLNIEGVPKDQSSPEAHVSVWQQGQFWRWEIVSTSPITQAGSPTPCRLSTTAYSIYSQLSSILEAVPPSATWGRAMPWWQGPAYHGYIIIIVIICILNIYFCILCIFLYVGSILMFVYFKQFLSVLQGAAEIVKHFKILVTCFSARVSRSASIWT